MSIPDASGAAPAARTWLAYERPVSAARTRPAAEANALPSATPPGDAGVETGGDQAAPSIQWPRESTSTLPPRTSTRPGTSGRPSAL